MSFSNSIWNLPLTYWHQIAAFCHVHQNFLVVAMIPFMYGFIGWFTNCQAVKMIFSPLKFWGIPPYLGWRGIIPRKAEIFAAGIAAYFEENLVNLPEVFERLDPRVITRKYETILDDLIDDVVNEVFDKSNPLVWKLVPGMLRREIINAARNQAPKAVRLVINEIQKNISEILKLQELSVEAMSGENVPRLVQLVKTVGKKQFRLIEMSGFCVGFILGIVPAGIWIIYPALWILPVQGIIVGYITNWLAVNMIFRPLEEKRYLFFKWQGLFINRKTALVKELSKMVAKNVLSSQNIIKKIMMGNARGRITLIIRMAVSQALDRMTGVVKPIITSTLNSDTLDMVKHEITLELTSEEATQCIEDYVEEALNVEQIMVDKFAGLNSAEFEKLLRPIFHDDEPALIWVGAVLGGVLGFLQLWLMY